jgi:hypothetical protein
MIDCREQIGGDVFHLLLPWPLPELRFETEKAAVKSGRRCVPAGFQPWCEISALAPTDKAHVEFFQTFSVSIAPSRRPMRCL